MASRRNIPVSASMGFPMSDGLERLNCELMCAVRGEQDQLPRDLRSAIDKLGCYTQQLLVNAPLVKNMVRHDSAVTKASKKPTYGALSPGSKNVFIVPNDTTQVNISIELETPLSVACVLGKLDTVRTLYGWQARLHDGCIENIFLKTPKATFHDIVREIITNDLSNIHYEVLMTACRFNELAIVAMCCDHNILNMMEVPPRVENERDFCNIKTLKWRYENIRSYNNPLVQAISHGSIDLVRALSQQHFYGDFEDVTEYELAAFKGSAPIVEVLLSTHPHAPISVQRTVYEIFGAACIIDCRPVEGKAAWAKALAVSKNGHDDTAGAVSQIGMLQNIVNTSWSAEELDKMTPTQLLLQALIVMERYFGDKRLLTDALLARPTTIPIGIHTLDLLVQQEKLTSYSLHRVEQHLDQLGFFRGTGEAKLRLRCLEWCIYVMNHHRLNSLQVNKDLHLPAFFIAGSDSGQMTANENNELRVPNYRELLEFTCRVIVSLDCLEETAQQDKLTQEFLRGLFRQTSQVCRLLEETKERSNPCKLIDCLKKMCPRATDRFKLLTEPGIDLAEGKG